MKQEGSQHYTEAFQVLILNLYCPLHLMLNTSKGTQTMSP